MVDTLLCVLLDGLLTVIVYTVGKLLVSTLSGGIVDKISASVVSNCVLVDGLDAVASVLINELVCVGKLVD